MYICTKFVIIKKNKYYEITYLQIRVKINKKTHYMHIISFSSDICMRTNRNVKKAFHIIRNEE